MGDDWMTPEHKEAARQGHLDMVRSVVENAPTVLLARELRRRECTTNGHDFDVATRAGEPYGLTCACGDVWVVKPVETSTAAEPEGSSGC